MQEAILWPVFYPAPAFPGILKILKNENCCNSPWFSKSQQPDASLHSFRKSELEQVGIAKSQRLFPPRLSSFGGKKGYLGLCLFCPATHLNGVIRWPPDWIWVALLLAMVISEEKAAKTWERGMFWWIMSKTELAGRKGKSALVEENQRRAPFPDVKVRKWSR